MRFFRFLIFIFLLAPGLPGLLGLPGPGGAAQAQVLTPTRLGTALSQPTARVGDELTLLVNARIAPTWHLYATDFSDEVGPVVFTLKFAPSPAYKLLGKPESVNSHHEQDDVFKGEVAFWEKTGQIRQRIKVLAAGPLTIRAEADYQSCTDVDGRCVPGNETLTWGPLAVAAVAGAVPATGGAKATSAAVPAATAATTAAPAAAATVPAAAVAAAAGATPAPPPAAATPVTPPAAVASTQPDTQAVAPVATARAEAHATNKPTTNDQQPTTSLWGFALAAFLSGLVALLTPCVFPLIPMTVSFFTSGSDSRARGILKAVVYGLSIVFVYVVLGMVVSVALGPDALNFMATHWLPNLIFFAVFVVFGLSFLGLFEITLPSGLVNSIDAQADKGGWGGVFFMALTLVLVSFSCTGPIVTSLLTMASQGQRLTPVVGMLGFSLAFALPFTLFAVFPAWLKGLPRSGGWLNTVKVVMGFVELGLALKFLSMADLAYHWHLLPRDLYLVLWIVLAGLLGLYLLGKYRLSHDSADLAHLSVGRLLMAVLAFSFMVYLVPGLFGAPLPLLAGYLPPQSKHDFTIAASAQPITPPTRQPANPLCEAPRHADFLELPHNLPGFFDLAQAQRCARAQNKPIFVDFTGHACVNCRKMEATVWADPRVLAHLRDDYVVLALYVDDKTELPPAEWYTSPRDGQQKTTLGKQNADLQLTGFQGNAQPLYALLDPHQPADRAHALTPPLAYEADPAAFAAFLEDGLRAFRAKR